MIPNGIVFIIGDHCWYWPVVLMPTLPLHSPIPGIVRCCWRYIPFIYHWRYCYVDIYCYYYGDSIRYSTFPDSTLLLIHSDTLLLLLLIDYCWWYSVLIDQYCRLTLTITTVVTVVGANLRPLFTCCYYRYSVWPLFPWLVHSVMLLLRCWFICYRLMMLFIVDVLVIRRWPVVTIVRCYRPFAAFAIDHSLHLLLHSTVTSTTHVTF